MVSLHCLCGSAPARIKRIGGPRFGERRLWRCRQCGLAQLFPWPAGGVVDENLYQDGAYMSKIPREEYFGYFRALEDYLQQRHRISRACRVLDFGAGWCWYQRFFTEAGYREAHSLEINRALVRHAREKLGLPNVHSDASTLPRRHFDLVISNQVFEHLPDPVKVLSETIAPVLAPGGLVCLSVPNWDALNRPLLRHRWLGYSPEDHLWFFNRDSARAVFGRAEDFELVDLAVQAAAGKPYDAFRPRGLIKALYYRSAWRLFERIGRGDQLIVALRLRGQDRPRP
jgi:SAM-dependent methyltransferase